jgi:tRNA threonylcarbamoyladenosine modification (KEOPS) complex  Pcc1 subunit
MNVELKLKIKCNNSNIASMLESSLLPDNKDAPKDQRIETYRKRNTLVVTVKSERAGSALSSARSILSDVKLFSRLIDAIGIQP